MILRPKLFLRKEIRETISRQRLWNSAFENCFLHYFAQPQDIHRELMQNKYATTKVALCSKLKKQQSVN